MLQFHVVSVNTSPVEIICNIQVGLQISYSGEVGTNGEQYISPQMATADEVMFNFAQIRQSLDLAEQRALALLKENED
jgi:hypothetical protein